MERLEKQMDEHIIWGERRAGVNMGDKSHISGLCFSLQKACWQTKKHSGFKRRGFHFPPIRDFRFTTKSCLGCNTNIWHSATGLHQ